eukprot:CFRG5429T1
MFKKILNKLEDSLSNSYESPNGKPPSTQTSPTSSSRKKYSLEFDRPWNHVSVKDEGGECELLNTELLRLLATMMPMKEQFHDWKLIYSSNKHGTTSSTLYSRCSQHGGPNILVVKIDKDHIVGAFTSHPWTFTDSNGLPHRTHFGCGTCFLFTLQPQFRIYPWSGKNEYFMLTDRRGLHLGLSDGFQGLWIDQSLTRGASYSTDTYDNECLAGEDKVQFNIASIEVYGVIPT